MPIEAGDDGDGSTGSPARPARTSRLLQLTHSSRLGLWVVLAAWFAVLAGILSHSLFVSHDSLSNYGHVWWVAEQLRSGGGLTFHMPVLGHGEALTFPYGFLPWLVGGILALALGDWAVTLLIVLGFVAVVAAMFWALPEIRRGWWAVAALLNPTLVMAPIIGQLPFLWATAFLFAAVGCWRRDRRIAAVVLAVVAQSTHPAILMPIAFLIVAGWLPRERNKGRLLAAYGVSVLASLPAAYLVFDSPVMEDTGLGVKTANFAATLAVRLFVVAAPLLLAALQHSGLRWLPKPLVRRGMEPFALGVVALAIILNVVFLRPFEMTWAWAGLARRPDRTLAEFAQSAAFTPGATYRVLRAGDGKVGMYQLMKAGGRLDSEFFPESIGRHSFPDPATYSAFLRKRSVDTVIVFGNYDRRWQTNEHALLDDLATDGGCSASRVGVTPLRHAAGFDVYRIQRVC
jgi:hypothetical protein